MRFETDSLQFGVSDSTPEQAGQNIQDAKELGVDPFVYKTNKEVYTPILEAKRMPAELTPRAKEVADLNPELAALMKTPEEISRLGYFEKQMHLGSMLMKGKDLDREINDILFKKIHLNDYSDEDDLKVTELNVQKTYLNTEDQYGLDFWQNIPAQMPGVAKDFYEGIKTNLRLVGGAAALYGGLGAARGVTTGPVGALVGGGIGATIGTVKGSFAANIFDQYKQSSSGVYNDLSLAITEQGEPLNLPEAEKKSIAIGVGVVSSAISLVGGAVVAKTVPWIGGALSPKQFTKFILRPENTKWFNLTKMLGNSELAAALAKGAAGEGAEEAAQTVTEIVGKAIGESWDGNETSLMNGFSKIADWETWKQAGKSFVVGGAAGSGFTAVGRATGEVVKTVLPKPKEVVQPPAPTKAPPTDIIGLDTTLPTPLKATQALQLQAVLVKGVGATQETNLKRYSPEQIDRLRAKVAEDAGVPYVWIDREDLNKWANNESKIEKLRSFLDPTTTFEAGLNTPVKIETSKFMSLADDDMSIIDSVKGNPEDLTISQYMEMIKTKKEAQEKALTALKEGAAAEAEVVTPEQRMTDEEIFNEQDYLNQPIYTEAIEKIVPENERENYIEAQKQARLQRIESLDEAAQYEMNTLKDLTTEIALEIEKETQAEKVDKDPNIQVVERFLQGRIFGVLTPEQKALQSQGKPVLQIDLNSLPEKLRKKYESDPILKARKVFYKSKKGEMIINNNPDNVARAYGIPNVEMFLDLMSKTLSREEAVQAAIDLRTPELKLEIENSVDLDESRIAKAYNSRTQNHLAELKYLLREEWGQFKKGVKRIALKLPTMTDLRNNAIATIKNSKLKDLNVNQWKVGENKSHKKAVDAILKNEVELAFREREAAAMNSELGRATHIAIGKVNRAMKRIARFKKAAIKGELKEAGYLDAAENLMDIFGLDRSLRANSKENAYRKYAEKLNNDGQGDFRIPEEVATRLQGAEGPTELTVEEFLYLADKLESILHTARKKNTLMDLYKNDVMDFTKSIMREAVLKETSTHPDRDLTRADQPQVGTGSEIDSIKKAIGSFAASLTNLEFITLQLDKGKVAGFFSKLIYHPLKGIGEYKDSIYGETAALALAKQIDNKIKIAIKAFGKSEFENFGIEKIKVKEFEDVPALKNDDVTKLDLFMMLLHTGNDYNRNKLENFGISADIIEAAIKKHLDVRAYDLAQEIWDVFAALRPRVKANHKIMTGNDIQFTPPRELVAFGKSFRGGYFPLKYKRDTNLDSLVKKISRDEILKGGAKKSAPEDSHYYEGIVDTPFTEARTGSEWEINISPYTIALGIQEVTYGLTMSVPVKGVMELITDPVIAKEIISIVGPSKFDVMVSSVAEATTSLAAEQMILFHENAKNIGKAVDIIGGGFAVSKILFNPSSVVIQLDSMRNVLNKMGIASGFKYLSWASTKFMMAPLTGKFGEMIKISSELDPGIAAYREGIDDVTHSGVMEMLPKRRAISGKPYHFLKNLQEFAVNQYFKKVLGGVDISMKTVTSVAAFMQFTNGDAPGYPISEISKMTPDQLYRQAQAYAAEISSLSLTSGTRLDRAPIQKNVTTKLAAKFWNDGRNSLNSNMQILRNSKYNIDKSIEKAKSGEMLEASLAFHDGTEAMMRLVTLSVLGMWFQLMARSIMSGYEDEEKNVITPYDHDTLATYLGRQGLSLGDELFAQHIPFMRDIVFALKTAGDRPDSLKVGGVLGNVMTDAAIAAYAGGEFAYNLYEGLNLIDAFESLTEKQFKALLNTSGFLVGGIPVNGAMKWYRWLEEPTPGEATIAPGLQPSIIDQVIERAKQFIEKYDNSKPLDELPEEEQMKELERQYDKDQLQQAVEEAKEIVKQLNPEEPISEMTDNAYSVIKYAESSGVFHASPGTTSAYGFYQFVTGTWKNIMEKAPQLGLTLKGRTESVEQQEKAMRWLTEDNIKTLKKSKVPITLQTVYGAHHFGSTTYALIHKSPDRAKLKKLLGKEKFKDITDANPWMIRDAIRTSGDLKEYLLKRLESGKRQYEVSQR